MAVGPIVSLFGTVKMDTSQADTALNNLERRGPGIGRVLKAGFMVGTTAALGFAAASIKAAVSFETAFAGVVKTVNETDANLAILRQGILDMAKDATNPVAGIPNAQVALAGIAEQAGQLGVTGVNNILKFTETIAKLRLATNLGDEAATSLAQFLNITGSGVDTVGQLGNVIVELGNNMATEERSIVEFMTRLASAGSLAGLTDGEISALAATLASVGGNAESSGTSITRTFTQISDAVSGNTDLLRTFADVTDMSSEAFSNLARTDRAGALDALVHGLGRLDEAAQLQALRALGLDELRVSDTLRRMAGAGDLFTEALGYQNKALTENNALNKEAEARLNTTAAQWELVKNQFRDIQISFGTFLLPYIRQFLTLIQQGISNIGPLADLVGGIFDGLGKKLDEFLYGKAPEANQTMGALFEDISKPRGFIGKFEAGLKTITDAMEGIGLGWDEIKRGAELAWDGIKFAATSVFDFAKGQIFIIVDTFDFMKRMVVGNWNTIREIARSAIGIVVTQVGFLWDAFQFVWDKVNDIVQLIAQIHVPDIPTAVGNAGTSSYDIFSGNRTGSNSQLPSQPLLPTPHNIVQAMKAGKNLIGLGASFIPGDTPGRFRAGQPYMVGTGAQPELFIPDHSGTKIPNADTMMGNTMNVNMTIYADSYEGGRSAARGATDELTRYASQQGFSITGITG